MTDDKAKKWDLKRLALYGLLFGVGYGIIRLSWGAGAPADMSQKAPGSGFLISSLIGGGIAGAFLAVLVGAVANLVRR